MDRFVCSLCDTLFFRSRRHSSQFRFYRTLLGVGYGLGRPFSNIQGLFFQLQGRLDKRARTRGYKFFAGKVNRQKISGRIESRSLQTITKNGTFGVRLLTRLKG